MMRETVSALINRAIAYWFSPYGVVLTFLLAVGVHLYVTATGLIGGFFSHYVLALSELAIVITAMVGHSTILSSKANDLKEDALIRALPAADNRLVGAENLTEGQIDQLGREVRDVHREQPPVS